jgi:glycosidase
MKDLGLAVHVFTFRNEPTYLNWDDGQDYENELQRFLDLGIDGFFSDFAQTISKFFNSKTNHTNSSVCLHASAKNLSWAISIFLMWSLISF